LTTFIQLHLLTSAPPSCINRDDLGAPKSAIFGGEQRLRISSQALKRAWRTSTVFRDRLDGHLAIRTQRLGSEILDHLIAKGVDEKVAAETARKVAGIFGKVKSDSMHTEQLAFIAPTEEQAAFALADRLAAGEKVETVEVETEEEAEDGKKGKKTKKLASKLALTNVHCCADIAMFGRMFADAKAFSGEAAVQVAHAITTHRAVIEDDYLVGIDDLNGHDESGAGFIGNAGFGSGLFYLYVCIDTDLLVFNLGGDVDLAKAAVAALIEAAATVTPGGKQASFASRTRASYVMAERGDQQPRSLAEAFLKGVDARDAFTESKLKLIAQKESFERAYGEQVDCRAMSIDSECSSTLADVVAFACGWEG
jgi:CRISPR system Cascade subunit CasC